MTYALSEKELDEYLAHLLRTLDGRGHAGSPHARLLTGRHTWP